ncbi:MAG TPA: hypothetical protein VG738_12490 [Chitinophagaceae bacterium]|nr:hypothetical protein [Chitinophagaceae bacterium]
MKLPFAQLYPSHFSGYIFLAFCWLFTGFAMGTIILLWPLRIWVNFARDNNLPSYIESAGVIVMILFLVVLSFRLSLQLFQWQLLSGTLWWRMAALALPCIAAIIALWLFLHPDIINSDNEGQNISEKFTIGPYPDETKIVELKKEGYTDIISLLHPAVVPFEPRLIKEEEAAAAKNGIHLIEAPMLPWIGDNEASLKKIENIVKTGKGKYYIHCYLGKDRVNVVRNMLTRLNGKTGNDAGDSRRTFEEIGSFERGDVYRIDSEVYVTPFPTDEEFLSFFLAGNVKTVVNIMDSTEKGAEPWIVKERKVMEEGNIKFKMMTVKALDAEPYLRRIIDSVNIWPKPLVVHHWNTTCRESVFFRREYYKAVKAKQVNLAIKEPVVY